VVLESIEDHREAVALGGPGAGDGGDARVAADADEAGGARGIVRLDGLDVRMLGEEAPALLERHLVTQRLADVAQLGAGDGEQGVPHGEQVLADLQQLKDQRYVSPYTVAAIYTGLGDKDQAFKWLETAVEERDIWLMNLKVDPVFAKLRSERKFTDILARIRLRP